MKTDLKKRKAIRLKDYDYAQQNAYFITICTHHRAPLFGEIVGATLCGRPNRPDELVIKWLLELEQKFKAVVIDSFVIMPDHIHFILVNTGRHTGRPLPEILDWFKTQTTNDYIHGVRDGRFPPFDKHIWQRTYYEHVIRNEQDLNDIRTYIANNPAKWAEKTYFTT